jgi:predicted PurR-regulated permease PerM
MRQAKGAGNGEWLTRQRTLNLVLAAVTAIVLYLCYAMTAPFIAPLTWALALAVVTHPLHAWVRKRLRRESIAAGLAVLAVTAVLIGPAVFVAQQIATEGAAAIEQVEKGVARGRSKQAIEKIPGSSRAWHGLRRKQTWRRR